MRNVILKHIFRLFVHPIYSLLWKGWRNEDCRYALLSLAMEVVSFILDLIGGIHWGCLLASFLLSVLILETTIYAYFIKRPRIKAEAQKLIAVEIAFPVLQLIISCYCLIRTLSGVKTNYSLSVFPLAYAVISVLFTFKGKKDVSHSFSDISPDTPSNQSSIVKDTDELEINSIRVDPSDTPVDSADPLDPTLASIPTSSANVPQASTLRQRNKQSQLKAIPTIGSVPSSQANEIQPEPIMSSRDKITSEQSDDHRHNNDKAKSSSKFVKATWATTLVFLLVGIVRGVAMIPYIFNLILPMLSRRPSPWISIKSILSPFYTCIVMNVIIVIVFVTSSFPDQLHQPTKTKKKRTRMELVGSRDESDSRDTPLNSLTSSLSSYIWGQIVYEDGVKEEEEEEENPIFSIKKETDPSLETLSSQTHLKEDSAAENPTRTCTNSAVEEE